MNGSWTETRLTYLEQAIGEVKAWIRSLTIGNSRSQQAIFTTGSVVPLGNEGGGNSRTVRITGPVSGGVYPGEIVERTSGGSWMGTGELVEVLAI